MMTVNDFLKMITNPDRVKIVKGKEVLFVGYKGDLFYEQDKNISQEVLESKMESFQIEPEIRAKDWEKYGLMPPLQPEQTPDYKFSDMEMKLYYKICI